jgi:3-dehydroquinate dehydratase-1
MRPQSIIKVKVKDRVIGGQNPLICLPLVAMDKSTLLEQAKEIEKLGPDLIEWRADSFSRVEDLKFTMETLKDLRGVIASIPLVFTCRPAGEGGFREIPQDIRIALIKEIIKSGLADMVDFEISNGSLLVKEIKGMVEKGETRLMLSYHNFSETPGEEFLLKKLEEAQELGADIAKIAVMPGDFRDVLNLLSATLRARTEKLKIPVAAMAMDTAGLISRIAGGLFGSDITYAEGTVQSAPGQIHVHDIRRIWDIIYGEHGRREKG